MDKLSPTLYATYQTLLLARRQGLLTAAEFRDGKATILKQQATLNKKAMKQREKREAQRIEKERREAAERERVARMEEEKRKAKKREAAKLRREKSKMNKNVVFKGRYDGSGAGWLYEIFKVVRGMGQLRFITPTLDFPITAGKNFDGFRNQFLEGGASEGQIIVPPNEDLLVLKPVDIPATRLRQMFRDGISHCVFTPILSKLENALQNSNSKESKKRYSQRISKLNELKVLYEDGVPEDKMEDVAKASGLNITILDVLGNSISSYNDIGKVGSLAFTNTRPNHVDIGKMTLTGESILISQEEMNALWNKLDKQREFYLVDGDMKNGLIRKIRTIDNVYEVTDKNKEYFNEMDEIAGIHQYRFNATKYPDVNEFMKEGRIINAWSCPFSDMKPTGHLDMPKAYTQFKKCSYFSGFLGMIHEWRSGSFDKKWLDEHIGIYRIRVVRNENPLFQKLGLNSTHILPSPEILYFMDNGVEVEIDAGVWGSKMDDFDFPESMLEDRRYCLWSGRLGMEYHHKTYSFRCNTEWASHLKAEYGKDVYYWEDSSICSIRRPVDNVFTSHHIFAFLTSYVRIQMLEAMKKFNVDQLVSVVLDGIYYVGDKPSGLEWFVEKPIHIQSKGFGWYDYGNDVAIDWSPVRFSGNTLLTGQGGAGKTYSILTDSGYNNILFVVPTHKLGGDANEKYDSRYTTYNKLLGIDCQAYKDVYSYPPVLLCDELTMVDAPWVEKIFTMYPKSLILLAGDLDEKMWYQVRNGCPGQFSQIWKPVGVNIFHVPGDRRSRDDNLKELKLRIREYMQKVFIDGDSGEVYMMKDWAMKNLKITNFFDACAMFTPGDTWIAATHNTNESLVLCGIVSGYNKPGGFFSADYKDGYTKRGSFTIHSYQGSTIESGKIFISVTDMFEYAMLYTAVSRAVNFNQLVFVG